jgi:hypothetical protein
MTPPRVREGSLEDVTPLGADEPDRGNASQVDRDRLPGGARLTAAPAKFRTKSVPIVGTSEYSLKSCQRCTAPTGSVASAPSTRSASHHGAADAPRSAAAGSDGLPRADIFEAFAVGVRARGIALAGLELLGEQLAQTRGRLDVRGGRLT